MSFNYIHYTEVDSTNKEAKRYVSEGGEIPAMILSDRQTAGKGRMGRRFFSSDIGGLYMTIVLKAPPENVFMRATALAAVCTVDSLRELFGVETQIKWVNDIFYKSKKLGGILAESFFIDDERYVAVGFGINLHVVSFPPELKNIAISLFSSYPNEEEQYRIKKELSDRIADKFYAVVESGVVEYAPGKEGMVHISKIADKRIDKVEDVLSLGDTVKVKYIGLDKKGRMDFSIKDAK